jgi:hypothetical protein
MDKPRLVELTQAEANLILSAVEDLSYPVIFGGPTPGIWYGYADDMRAWRLQRTSSAEPK